MKPNITIIRPSMLLHSLLAMGQQYEITISTAEDEPIISPTAAPDLLNQPVYAMSREERQSLKAKQRKAAKKPARKGGRP